MVVGVTCWPRLAQLALSMEYVAAGAHGAKGTG